MADIELVIKIPEELYKANHRGLESEELWDLRIAISEGTPLPKGHGRLIDADKLNRKDLNCANVPMNFIDIAPTIIEADKGYDAKVITRGNCMICGKELTEGLFFCKECGDKVNSRK